MKQIIPMQVRVDPAGDGNYGAPRNNGSRPHRGIDFVCVPGAFILSPVNGVVTKHGWPYQANDHYKYIQITDENMMDHRLFYVEPMREVDSVVLAGEVVGCAQDISLRYSNQGMMPHVHYEVRDRHGEYYEPSRV